MMSPIQKSAKPDPGSCNLPNPRSRPAQVTNIAMASQNSAPHICALPTTWFS